MTGLSERKRRMLEIIAAVQGGVGPSQFAFLIERAGLVHNRTGRKWRAQGAGRIGGRELALLCQEGLVRGDGEFGRDHVLTEKGMRALAGQAGP